MKRVAILLGLLLAGTAFGQQAWKQLATDGASAGLDTARFEGLVERCREAGLSAEVTRTITAGLLHACEHALPIDSIYTKIDEGLAKHAGADQISRAAGIRVQKLEQADALLRSHRAKDARGRTGLIAAAALALESGVPESAVARLLSHPNADRPGRVMAAIEGLETLHAQGFPTPEAERLMAQAISRDLRRYELLGAIDLALRKQHDGADPTTIELEAGPSVRGRGGPGRGSR
jgi:hypothetical protein